MALTRLYSFLTGSVVTNAIITGEFDNIYNNALTLISPLTGNLAAGGNSITGLALGSAASPSLQYTGDTNTGIYSSGADALDLVGGGLRLMTLTSTPVAGIVSIDPGAITATAATNVARFFVGGTSALTIPAGVTAIAAGEWIAEPNFTATGTITRATTWYVAAAPTEGGTANYAAWIDAGTLRLDGTLDLTNSTVATGTLTSISGSATLLQFSGGSTATVWNNNANSSERMRLTDAGVLLTGTTVATSASAGDLVMANAAELRGVNAAGNDTVFLIGLTSSDVVNIGGASAAVVTLGGAVPTGATASDLVLRPSREVRFENAAGNNTVSALSKNASDLIMIGGGPTGTIGPLVNVVLTANLPGAAAARDGYVCVEDAGAGDRNLVIYGGGQRFRIDGGTAF